MTGQDNKTTKQQRRAAAREKARKLREAEKRAERRRRIAKWGVAIALPVIAIALIVVLVLSQNKTATIGAAPAGATEQGGIVLTDTETFADGPLTAVDVDTVDDPDPEATAAPPGADAAGEGEPATVVVYADPNCVHCAEFENNYGSLLQTALDNGEITLEYRVVNYLDHLSSSRYSTRASEAAACVAQENPSAYLPFLGSVFSAYGDEPDNEQLTSMAADAGADIGSCLDERDYRAFVDYTSAQGLAAGVTGTPSVWVQGESWADSGQDFPTFLSEAIAS